MPASVILVDDQASTRMAMGALLEDAGYQVLTVPDADTALAALAERHHDVVVTDVLMPGKSGLDLLDEVAARWPDVAVLLITGEPNITTASQAVRAGAYDYLGKPISGDLLASAISAALERRERRTSARALQESEASLAALLQHAPVPVVVSLDGDVVSANPALLELLDIQIDALVGADVLTVFHEEDRERLFRRRATVAETSRPLHVTPVRLLRADGEVEYCVGRGIPVRYKGKRCLVVMMAVVAPELWQSMMTQQEC
jgi:PAS domain S-box-containing protein